MRTTRIVLTAAALLISAMGCFAQSGWELRLMPQLAFGTRNDVQRPNDNTGTRLSLNDDFSRKHRAVFSPRIELEYFLRRHHIIATVALLTNRFDGEAPFDISYDYDLFRSGSHVDALYRFNTYRLGYRYRFVDRPRFVFEFGATLLLRNAVIWLEDADKKSSFYNTGLAPLLSFNIEWKATENLSLLSYGDAFGIKAGRAEDIFAGVRYRFTPLISAMAGYRFLEGGSDGSRVYTMAAFHYLSLGLGLSF